jgi:Ca2+-binding EF-hand superfamily protein
LLAAILGTCLGAPAIAADADLAFSDRDTTIRLRVEVTADGQPPETAWAAFLDKLFAHFDRDGDGVLSEAEARRVFPLPLPGGREVVMDFAALDTNRDGKATPAEFRTFYRDRGFTPVTVVAQPAPADVFAVCDALFRHLDRDNDGKLSAAELRQAVALLKRLDEDEDEVLAVSELLGGNRAGGDARPAGLKLVPAAMKAPTATLRLTLGGTPTLVGEGESFRLEAVGSRLRVPGGVCGIALATGDPTAGFRAAKGYYLAQFRAAAGDRPATKQLFEDDPTAQVLAGLFDAADRDGDGNLTRAELESFFDLVELGVGCRVIVTVTDRGRNLFDLFDTDGDGRLDLGELARAGRNLPRELARDAPVERGAVPASYRLTVGRGPVGVAFGPVPFGAAARPKATAAPPARGPAWFRAMDRNGDGFVSAHEFLGPPELFAKLDLDGDGRISVEEAEAAGK